VSRDGRIETVSAEYVCGCDGAHSAVRETLGIGFPGGTYDQLFYVADVRITRGFDRDLWVRLGEPIFTAERVTFARCLVSTTDRAFAPLVADSVSGELTRRVLAPLSEGKAGHVHGGDRLPWIGPDPDNFAPLRSLDWQVHVYGHLADDLARSCGGLGLPTHAFARSERVSDAGFKRDAAYLVRPDGYVAVALPDQHAATLTDFVRRFGIRAR
jgi:FAD binding domain-containing protein